uniref:Metabotropic glutamate receptor Homer-binding domain-containing protein n=1 Tax=Loxodonta africana TaxID=9785 RepID=G3U1G3_LOXAF
RRLAQHKSEIECFTPKGSMGNGGRATMSSSNGKSVTWAQNERSTRGQHLWQRLSIHINKKENPNQTAVIKPFPKSTEIRGLGVSSSGAAPGAGGAGGSGAGPSGPEPPEASPKALYDVAEAEEHFPAPARPRSPSPISTLSHRAGSASRTDDDVPSLHSEPAARSSSSQGSLMEQISSVVTRFTANISELNSMMLSTTAPAGVGTPLCSTYLIPKEIQLPTTMTTFAEIQPLPAIEVTGGAQPAGPETPVARPEAAAAGKPDLEEVGGSHPAHPPFRDSVGLGEYNPNSARCSESALCIAFPNYDTLIIRHYTQSSSSL